MVIARRPRAEQLVEYGGERQAIPPAIRELVALGFVEVTAKGRHSAGDIRVPNLFRITWINSKSSPHNTHEWRRIKTMDAAREIARVARAAKDESAVRKSKSVARKNTTHGGKPTLYGAGKPILWRPVPMAGKSILLA
jgi:hypothetical protein